MSAVWSTTRTMSFLSVITSISISTEDYQLRKALLWVMSQIDTTKLMERAIQAHHIKTIETRCVLLEYNYTAWKDVRVGRRDQSDRVPGTDLLVHNVFESPVFWRLANQFLVGPDSDAVAYVRRKITEGGAVDPTRRQLMLVFPKAIVNPEDSDSDDQY